MSDPIAVGGDSAVLDPRKRVRYTTGLVLGVDELTQEQHYFLSQHRGHQRALHGYGTVRGLGVHLRDAGAGPEVVVEPGTAVVPSGATVRVATAQCARLDEWLARHREEVAAGGVTLFVVLAYRECATDPVPIPGGACRTQEESSAAARVAEDFDLSLRLTAPAAAEEEAVRRFGTFLGRLIVDPGGDGQGIDREVLLSLVRGLAAEPPPSGAGDQLLLPPAEAAALLRAVHRVWVTEVRPAESALGEVLLARLDFEAAADGKGSLAVAGPVTVDEDERPVLLPTRLLQERRPAREAPIPQSLTAAASVRAPAKQAPEKKAPAAKKAPATKKAPAKRSRARKRPPTET